MRTQMGSANIYARKSCWRAREHYFFLKKNQKKILKMKKDVKK